MIEEERPAGDGTTTAIVLAHSMANDALKFITSGVKLNKGMLDVVNQVADFIDHRKLSGYCA